MQQTYDVLVVGGGPAGLSAALHLARYNRRVVLLDAGDGRSSWHQGVHNYPGFLGGVAARHLRALTREQLGEYRHVAIYDEKVERLAHHDGGFVAHSTTGPRRGNAVILCVGVVDHFPEFPGWQDYVGRSMFWCLACDAYSCQDGRIVVAGNTDHAALTALQFQRFTDQLAVLTDAETCEIGTEMQQRLAVAGIPLHHDQLLGVEGHAGRLHALLTRGGTRIPLDYLFCQHEATPRTKLASDLGVMLSPEGYIVVDTDQKTTVPGVYAAGDVTRLHSHQVTTAVHEGGQAASAANYYLYPPELKGT